MNFSEAIGAGFRNYFKFTGRASRSEYWWFYLFTVIGTVIAILVDRAITPGYSAYDIGSAEFLWHLIIIIPSLSVSVRRLHDVNRSGWWSLLALTGFGVLVLVYWAVKPGGPDMNAHGDNPLKLTMEAD